MKLKKIGKKGAKGETPWYVWLILGVIIIQVMDIYDFRDLLNKKETDQGETPIGGSGSYLACPNDGDSTIILDLYNELNTTASEGYDATVYVFNSNGGLAQTLTDTTSPSGSNVNCGDTYTMKMVGADGNGGDNSKFTGVTSGENVQINNGYATFVADKSTEKMELKGRQHGVLQFKAYDVDNAGFMYNSDDVNNAYCADGCTFESIVNGTAKAVGVAETINLKLYVQGTATDTAFQDYYTLILIEGGANAITTWEDPALVAWAGASLTEVEMSSLTPEEQDAFNAYDWVYKVDTPIEKNAIYTLEIQMSAKAGQNPTADIEIDFASAGNYKSVSGSTVKTGAAKDDSSNSVLYALMDTTIDLS